MPKGRLSRRRPIPGVQAPRIGAPKTKPGGRPAAVKGPKPIQLPKGPPRIPGGGDGGGKLPPRRR